VYILLHNERRKCYSVVQAWILETKMSEEVKRGQLPPLRGGGERIPAIVEKPRNTDM
jgi:hypothetical protein